MFLNGYFRCLVADNGRADLMALAESLIIGAIAGAIIVFV